MDEITHNQAQEWIGQAQAGLLPPADRAALDAHLDACPDCRVFRTAFLEKDAALRRTLGEASPRPELTAPEIQAVARRVSMRTRVDRVLQLSGQAFRTLSWGAAALALVVSINWVFANFNGGTAQPAAPIASPSAAPPIAVPAADTPPPVPTAAPDTIYTPFSRQLRLTLTGSDSAVNSIAFSPDGRVLAAADAAGRVYIWRVRDGALLHTLEAHTREATSLTFSPDGGLLATGGKDGTVNIWFAESGGFVRSLLTGDADVLAIRFSPSSELLAITLSNYLVTLVRVSDGKHLEAFQSAIRLDVNQASDRNSYLIASAESAIWLQGDSSLPFSLNIHGQNGKSLDVVLSPSGSLLASSSTDGLVYIWRIFDITVTAEDPQTHQPMISRTITGNLLSTLTGHTGWVNSLDFSADGEYIVSGSDDGTIILWSVPESTAAETLIGHSGPVTSVDISPDDLLIASGSEDGSVKIWSLTDY